MSLKDTATRVAVLKAIKDAVDGELNAVREQATADLRTAQDALGVRSVDVTLPDGTRVASLTLTKTSNTFTIDADAFLAWVQTQHPTEVVTAVRDSFRRAVLGRLKADDGTVIDTHTGEVVEWATHVPAAKPSTVTLRFTDTGRNAIAEAWAAGQLDGVAPGPRAIEPAEEAS